METRAIIETDGEAGFSLLETLFALAIMSLASVALFQSTSSMLALSDRAVKTGERTVNGGLDRLALAGIINGMLPHWADNEDNAFTGDARELRGVTTGNLSPGIAAAERITLSLQPRANGTDALIYTSAQSTESWEVMAALPAGARFEYMGVDQDWHAAWPPTVKPTRGYFEDDKFQETSALPEAVRLSTADMTLWAGPISQAAVLPTRLDLDVGL